MNFHPISRVQNIPCLQKIKRPQSDCTPCMRARVGVCVCVPSGRYPNRGGRLRRATDPRVWSTAGTLALAVGRAPNTHKHLFGPSPTSCRTSSSTTLQHNTNRTAYIIIIKRCCVIIVSRWPSRLSSAVCRRDRLWVTVFVCRATNGRRRNERRAVTVNSRHVH